MSHFNAEAHLTAKGTCSHTSNTLPHIHPVPLQNYKLVHAKDLPIHSSITKTANIKSEIAKNPPYLILETQLPLSLLFYLEYLSLLLA